MFEQSIYTGVVIACFDAFCHTITKKTVVVVDNASIHRSEAFADRMPHWKKHGLIIKYLRGVHNALGEGRSHGRNIAQR
jgi:hypothetical protein